MPPQILAPLTDLNGIKIGVASCPSIGRFRRSAKAGQATQGTISNLRGKGNRKGNSLLVLPGWGRKRARVPAWDLGRVTNSRNTKARLPIGRQLFGRAMAVYGLVLVIGLVDEECVVSQRLLGTVTDSATVGRASMDITG